MNKTTIVFFAVVFAGGCVAAPVAPRLMPTGSPSSIPATPATTPGATGPTTLQGPVVLRSSSLSLLVDDPAQVMAEIERIVDEAGGYVASASAWSSPDGSWASLNARVPLDSLTDVHLAVRQLGLQVQSDSIYSQDVSADYQRLVERLRLLELAESEVQSLIVQADDPQRLSSFEVVLDLLRLEKQNIDGQVRSYDDRATLGTLDVSLNVPAPTPYLAGPSPTPIATYVP